MFNRQLYKISAFFICLFIFSSCQQYSASGDSSIPSLDPSCKYIDETTLPRQKDLVVPYVKQYEDYCGPAALSMVLEYYGRSVDQLVLGEGIVGPKGTTPEELSTKADEQGFYASVISCGFGNLLDVVNGGTPVIVRILNNAGDNGHFIVITGYNMDTETLYINDPDVEDRTEMTFNEFQNAWDIKTLPIGANSLDLMIIVKPKS